MAASLLPFVDKGKLAQSWLRLINPLRLDIEVSKQEIYIAPKSLKRIRA